MAKSAYLAQQVATYVVGQYPTMYLALFENGTEASYTGYQRQAVTPGTPVNGVWSNTNDILFPAPPVNESYNDLRLYSAQSGGNELYDESSISLTDPANEQLEYKASTVNVTEA